MSGVRAARDEDLRALSDLCLRSKGYWGYDDAFLEACRDELTPTAADLAGSAVVVIDGPDGPEAVARVSPDGADAVLELLYVDPGAMGRGHGRRLFDWAVSEARGRGAAELVIEADPNAAPFYERMGARRAGEAPSGSVAGRMLPRFVLTLG